MLMYFAGIDIAKNRHEVSVINAEEKALCDSIPFANSQEGGEKLLSLFSYLGIATDNLTIGMEATGHYWLAIYSFLIEANFNVKVINPIQSDAFRHRPKRLPHNRSSDALREYSETKLAEEGLIALRQLSRFRLALVDTCSDCKRRVIALLNQVFPEYASFFSDTFGVTSKELPLLRYPLPEDMLTVSTVKLTSLLRKARKVRFEQDKAAELKIAATSSFGIGFAKEAFSLQIRQLIEQINFHEAQVEELEKEITVRFIYRHCQKHRFYLGSCHCK